MATKKPKALKPPKTRNGGTMTEAAYFSKIRSVLRRGFQWWIPIQLALKAASRPSQSTNKRLKFEYQCALCDDWYSRKYVEIDHIVPCGSLLCYDDIGPFIERLTKENITDFQVVCKTCHKWKTLQDKEARKILINEDTYKQQTK